MPGKRHRTALAAESATAISPAPGQPLTPVAQDYLKVIWSAREWSTEPVSTKLLAERIGVSASTVSEAIRKLADQGLVDHARYGSIALTEEGNKAAVAMVRRHRLLETFLMQELGYGWDEVHDEAEVLEHAVSDLLMARIDSKLGYPERDPHGDPIPSVDGAVLAPPARPLSECHAGETGHIARISDADPAMLRYFESVGIALDAAVEVIERRDFAGTISVRLGDSTAGPIDLGHPAADAVWVVTNGSDHD